MLEDGADTVHPVVWPLWKIVGTDGLAYAGVAVVTAILGLSLFAFARSRREG